MRIIPVILSGGSGTRLWPLSRPDHPKQLQPLLSELTLLQETAKRLPQGLSTQNQEKNIPCAAPSPNDSHPQTEHQTQNTKHPQAKPAFEITAPLITCSEAHRFLIAEQMREICIQPHSIILEPCSRGTAAAIAAAAFAALAPLPPDEDAILAILPADHFISDIAAFQSCIFTAACQAAQGTFMLLGIPPTQPHTGYGYIQQGPPIANTQAFAVSSFTEKPTPTVAAEFLQSGKYFWNAGIFILSAKAYLSSLGTLQPEIYTACKNAHAAAQKDLDFLRLCPAHFAAAPAFSVDVAIMEKVHNIGVLPAPFVWGDIGEWPSLWQHAKKDSAGNVISGNVVATHMQNSLIRSESRLVTAFGLSDIVLIETADAICVFPKNRADEIRHLVAQLIANHHPEATEHASVWRPWGGYTVLHQGTGFLVKKVWVKPAGQLSLQLHKHRTEHWVVVEGTAQITIGETTSTLHTNESAFVPQNTIHRLQNESQSLLTLIEIQTGPILSETDIIRLADAYNRPASSA